MKRFFCSVFLLALLASATVLAPRAQAKPAAKSAGPRTVSDYFLSVPEDHFGSPPAELLRYATVRDNAHDYIEIQPPKGSDESEIKFTLFRYHGRILAAITVKGRFGAWANFLRYSGPDNWQSVTEDMIPSFSESCWYDIPRYGTTIGVFKLSFTADDRPVIGKRLYNLAWRDGKFVIVQ